MEMIMVSPESVATPAGQTPVNSTSGSGPSNGVSKACTSVSETSDSRGFLMDLNKMRPPRIPSDSPAPLTPLMAVRSGPASRALQLCIWAEVAYSGKQTKLRSLRHAAVYFLSTQQTGGATAGWALASWLQSTRTGDWDSLPGDVGEKLRLLCDGEVLTLQSLNDQTVIKLDGHALHKAAVDIVLDQAAVFEEAVQGQHRLESGDLKALIPMNLFENSQERGTRTCGSEWTTPCTSSNGHHSPRSGAPLASHELLLSSGDHTPTPLGAPIAPAAAPAGPGAGRTGGAVAPQRISDASGRSSGGPGSELGAIALIEPVQPMHPWLYKPSAGGNSSDESVGSSAVPVYDLWRSKEPSWVAINEHAGLAGLRSSFSLPRLAPAAPIAPIAPIAAAVAPPVPAPPPPRPANGARNPQQIALAMGCLCIWWPANPHLTALSIAVVCAPPPAADQTAAPGPAAAVGAVTYDLDWQAALAEVQRIMQHCPPLIDAPLGALEPYDALVATMRLMLADQPLLTLHQVAGGLRLRLNIELIARQVMAAVGLLPPDAAVDGAPLAAWPPAPADCHLPPQLLCAEGQQLMRPVMSLLRLEHGHAARGQLLSQGLRHLVTLARDLSGPSDMVFTPLPAPIPVHEAGLARVQVTPANGATPPQPVASPATTLGYPTHGNTFTDVPAVPPEGLVSHVVQLASVVYQFEGVHERALRCTAAVRLAAAAESAAAPGAKSAGGAMGAGSTGALAKPGADVSCKGALTSGELAALFARDKPRSWAAWQQDHPGTTEQQVSGLLQGVPGFTQSPTHPGLFALDLRSLQHAAATMPPPRSNASGTPEASNTPEPLLLSPVPVDAHSPARSAAGSAVGTPSASHAALVLPSSTLPMDTASQRLARTPCSADGGWPPSEPSSTPRTSVAGTPPSSRGAVSEGAWASAAATRAVLAAQPPPPPPPPPPPRPRPSYEQMVRWGTQVFPGTSVEHQAQRAMVQALAEVTGTASVPLMHCRTATELGQVIAERFPYVWAALTPMMGTRKYRLRPLIDGSPVFTRIKKPPSDCWIQLNVKELAAAAAALTKQTSSGGASSSGETKSADKP